MQCFHTAPEGVRRDSSETGERSLASMICISNFGECEAVAVVSVKRVRGQHNVLDIRRPYRYDRTPIPNQQSSAELRGVLPPFWGFPLCGIAMHVVSLATQFTRPKPDLKHN